MATSDKSDSSLLDDGTRLPPSGTYDAATPSGEVQLRRSDPAKGDSSSREVGKPEQGGIYGLSRRNPWATE